MQQSVINGNPEHGVYKKIYIFFLLHKHKEYDTAYLSELNT